MVLKWTFLVALLATLTAGTTHAQDEMLVRPDQDAQVIRTIFDLELTNGRSYQMLDYLANQIGGRLSGSPQAAQAVEWAHQTMDTLDFDTVYRQPVMVPRWVRGEVESGRIVNSLSRGTESVPVCALGGSIATPKGGLTAGLIEVQGFEELKTLGREKVAGKLVFYNRPMDPKHIYTFHAYGGCVDQRWAGAKEAAALGAVGVVVRSMNLKLDDYPHTGSMAYADDGPKIPAAAISTNGAELLSRLLKEQPDLRFNLELSCFQLPDVLSYNVIGEIKGSEFPDEIILVGGHLDAWDNGDGAHDDGAGCVQAMEVLRLFREMKVRPKRTIRVVLFMNEENGLRGAKKYAEIATARGDNHIVAIESDRGGFSPRGFHLEATESQVAKVQAWRSMLEPYGLHDIQSGGSGADISPLKGNDIILVGFVPDSQRYFDYHHSALDVFEAVNQRELEMGAASMAALVYLFSQYGN
ncbi:MAG: M20/M25/M40 family metallo-hydrolase [Salibacteraceae bacterium]